MRYEREDLCRIRGSKLRRVIREKYGKLMEFYALAAKMCRMSEHNIHMFLGCGRRSQKKHAYTILTMLGIGEEDFDTYFVGEEENSLGSPSGIGNPDSSGLVPLLHAIIDRLNGLEEKLDRFAHVVRISQEGGKETERKPLGNGVNVFDVAKYILHSFGEEISTMELQKLCYYCQAWHLAWHGIPLFPENFKRRDNGPVCMELFNVHCGKLIIKEEDIADRLLSGDMFSLIALDTINQVLEDYGEFNGAQLSGMTYQEDPWINTPKDEIISMEVMEEYYKNLKDEDD